jgi:hypothetical protein
MAGVKGRSGKKLDSIWGEAIRRAIKRREDDDPRAIERLASKLLDMADGEGPQALGALKEIGDRLDGKAAQQMVLSGVGENGSIPMIVTGVRRPGDASD